MVANISNQNPFLAYSSLSRSIKTEQSDQKDDYKAKKEEKEEVLNLLFPSKIVPSFADLFDPDVRGIVNIDLKEETFINKFINVFKKSNLFSMKSSRKSGKNSRVEIKIINNKVVVARIFPDGNEVIEQVLEVLSGTSSEKNFKFNRQM